MTLFQKSNEAESNQTQYYVIRRNTIPNLETRVLNDAVQLKVEPNILRLSFGETKKSPVPDLTLSFIIMDVPTGT
jgi:hypothetical protein